MTEFRNEYGKFMIYIKSFSNWNIPQTIKLKQINEIIIVCKKSLIKAEINNLVLTGPITITNIINDKGKNEKNSKLRTQNLTKPILENGSSLCTSLFL